MEWRERGRRGERNGKIVYEPTLLNASSARYRDLIKSSIHELSIGALAAEKIPYHADVLSRDARSCTLISLALWSLEKRRRPPLVAEGRLIV